MNCFLEIRVDCGLSQVWTTKDYIVRIIKDTFIKPFRSLVFYVIERSFLFSPNSDLFNQKDKALILRIYFKM